MRLGSTRCPLSSSFQASKDEQLIKSSSPRKLKQQDWIAAFRLAISGILKVEKNHHLYIKSSSVGKYRKLQDVHSGLNKFICP
jgi:hypothetical protein